MKFEFDDSQVNWLQVGDFEHFVLSILNVDEKNKCADVLYKFEPHKQIVLHKHLSLNGTFVVQGEHRLYEQNGDLKDVRQAGSYTSSAASDEPHRECGGDDGTIVLFNIREIESVCYEALDDDGNTIGQLSIQDFIDLYQAGKQ